MKLLSSFSLSMLENFPATIKAKEVDASYVKEKLKNGGIDSYIAHQDFALFLSEFLNHKIEFKREKVILKSNEKAIVAQIIGPRLPEGKVLTKEEIKQMQVKFILLEII